MDRQNYSDIEMRERQMHQSLLGFEKELQQKYIKEFGLILEIDLPK
jgi:hypothetical protein